LTPSAKTKTIRHRIENESRLPTLGASWRWWLLPALLSVALAAFFVDPFIGDWDGLDYTINAVNGSPSTMALGRLLFVFANHGLYLIAHAVFNLRVDQAYLLFKYGVMAQAPLAVIASWTLTRDLTRSIYSATVAALLVAVSPVFVIYSGQVMTDVPSVLMVTVALIIHLRGLTSGRMWLVLLGAALLGAGANVRETALFFGPWLVIAPFVCGWKLRLREIAWTLLACLIFLIMAFAPFAVWYAMDLNSYRMAWHVWRETTGAEIARHPNAREVVWVQEEPANMGALSFVLPRLQRYAEGLPVRSVKRSASASPATGSAKAHELEQKTLLALAFATRAK